MSIYSSFPITGVPAYANTGLFPTTANAGALAVDIANSTLFEFNGTTWVAIASSGGALSLGAFDSQAATATGLALVSSVLSAQSADTTHPGMVNNTAQSFSGAKTFTGAISASNLSGTNTGDLTLGTANGLSLASQALSLALSSTSTTGALSSTDWNTFNNKQASGNYITALTGDVTAAGPGSAAATIANLAITNAKIANSTIDLTAKVTGVLPVANGGTNSATALNNNRILQSSAGALVEAAAITASKALQSDANGIPVASSVTSTELGYVSGVTSSIQSQMNSKQATVTIGALDAQAENAQGLSLTSNVLSIQSADATHPGVVNNTAQTLSGAKTFSSIINADGGMDRSSSGTLTIGATNSSIINIGNAGATVNILGTTLYENVTTLQVADPLITLNKGGGAGSAANAGIELEENSVITGYAETSANRNSWILKAPNTAGIATVTPGASGITLDQSSHNPVTIGTANGLSLSTQALSLAQSSASVTGALSSTDWSTFNSKMAVPSISSISHIVYVNIGGNDSTGDGSLGNPYATVGQALASITTNTATNLFAIKVGPGIFVESTTLTLKPHIWISGSGQDSTFIKLGSSATGTIVASSTFAGAAAHFGLSELYVQGNVSLDFTSVATGGALLDLSAVNFSGTFLFRGNSGGNCTLVTLGVWFYGTPLTLDSAIIELQATYAYIATFSTTNADCDAIIMASRLDGTVTFNSTGGHSNSANICATAGFGSLVGSGSGVSILADAVSMPLKANITLSGGAVITRSSDLYGEAYTPTTSGDWNTVPTVAQSAVDTLASSGIVKSQTTNKVLASPNGSSGVPSFRALVAADLPAGTGTVTSVAMSVPSFLSVAGSPITTSGTLAVTLSGTALPLANGGTGQTTKAAAFDALSPMTTGGDIIYGGASGTGTRLANGSSGQVLTSNGTTLAPSWATPATGTVTAISVASANGFAGSSSGGATPALTLTTTITGLLKGNGTAISAATSGTDYSAGTSALATGILKSTTTTGALSIAVAGDFPALPYASSTLTNTHIFVGNGSNVATDVAMSGDATLANTGAITIANSAITNAKIANSTIDLTAKVTGALPIANGGTGQVTANAGFNALSPMTTGGDIIYGGASGVATRLANGSSGQVLTSSGTTAAPTWVTPTSAPSNFRNAIINGDMKIDNRNNGSAQTFTAAAALAYSVDRFYGYCTGANVTGQQVAGSGQSQYRYQFTGVASVTAIGFGQRIEAKNCYYMENQSCTLSVDLANSLLTTVTWTVYRATTTADTFGTLASPTVTSVATGTWTVNSTVTNYTAAVALDTSCTTGLQIVLTVGAQTSGTWTIGNMQFEQNASATVFEQVPYDVQIDRCLRYLPVVRTAAANNVLPQTGSAATTGAISGPFTFSVPARVAPTGVTVSAAGDFKLVRPSTGSLIASAISFGSAGIRACDIQWTVAGATVDQIYYLQAVNAGVIYFTGCEL